MRKIFILSLVGAVMILLNFPAHSREELKPADVIIGLGYGPAKNKKGEPKKELVRRVEKAVELYHQGYAPYLLFTGGETGRGCEAEVMAELAEKMGVPRERIFLETKATDTITNARYSVEIMKEQGWRKAILVSNPYHLRRAKWLFTANPEIEVQIAPSETPSNPFYHILAITYEGFAWTSYLFQSPRKKARHQLQTCPPEQ